MDDTDRVQEYRRGRSWGVETPPTAAVCLPRCWYASVCVLRQQFPDFLASGTDSVGDIFP